LFLPFKAHILNNPGIKSKKKGKIKSSPKLDKQFAIIEN